MKFGGSKCIINMDVTFDETRIENKYKCLEVKDSETMVENTRFEMEVPTRGIGDVRKNLENISCLSFYMALSDTRQRSMPTLEDRETSQTLAYPKIVLLTKPINHPFIGEWMININTHERLKKFPPINEFGNGGPIKKDLTSHDGLITLLMFVSTHYAGKEVTMAFEEGETYKKVFGPVFVYLNTDSTQNHMSTLWSDAKQQLSKQIQIQDRHFKGGRFQYTNAYVGLALPGDAGSWQRESKGYQFWTRANVKGYFKITNIVPGDYNLYGWVPGFIGDYKYNATITIAPGGAINLDSLVYSPPRHGPTIWKIGIPDRLASEFHVPNPYPTLMNKLHTKQHKDKSKSINKGIAIKCVIAVGLFLALSLSRGNSKLL
ncbi:unnamed protein product [Vicia faba]|uniref:Rhamnogalacturonan lyase domain-containing protein n=1 Tax=Vicia faba TaxID=3906 RepID=A0AAV0YE77_VICFA|nr:unnamed protein product [Vicia faba]